MARGGDGGAAAAAGPATSTTADITGKIEEMQKQNSNVFAIPDYFVYMSRAFATLEGIGLSSDPDYAILQECFPYLAKRLLSDDSPRARGALRTLLYGQGEELNLDQLQKVTQGLESYTTSTASVATSTGESDAGRTAALAVDTQHLVVRGGRRRKVPRAEGGVAFGFALCGPRAFIRLEAGRPIRRQERAGEAAEAQAELHGGRLHVDVAEERQRANAIRVPRHHYVVILGCAGHRVGVGALAHLAACHGWHEALRARVRCRAKQALMLGHVAHSVCLGTKRARRQCARKRRGHGGVLKARPPRCPVVTAGGPCDAKEALQHRQRHR